MRIGTWSGALALVVSLTALAAADTIGFIGAAGGGTPITTAGHTPVALTNLTAADLAGLDTVWVFNPSNGAHDPALAANQAAVTSFVMAGGVLVYHDRFVTNANLVVPGAGGVTFTRSTGEDVNIVNGTTSVTDGTGPGGALNNTSLDAAGFSHHGFATGLPPGAVPIWSTANATQFVDFYYGLGAGTVYYSAIPLDAFLGTPVFGSVYGPNVIDFATGFSSIAAVPEPASMALFGLGLVGLVGVARRRRRKLAA